MRKITKDAIEVFWNGGYFNRDNTRVAKKSMWLHGNNIACVRDNKLIISSCGWETTTTKERLNGVLSKLNMYIKQTKGVWRVYDVKGDSVPFEDGMTIKL
jgi:hypothetical protein